MHLRLSRSGSFAASENQSSSSPGLAACNIACPLEVLRLVATDARLQLVHDVVVDRQLAGQHQLQVLLHLQQTRFEALEPRHHAPHLRR